MNEDVMTIEELEKHIGEVLLFYYHDTDSQNQKLGTVSYMKKEIKEIIIYSIIATIVLLWYFKDVIV